MLSRLLGTGAATVAILAAGLAAGRGEAGGGPGSVPERFALGRDANGEPCAAQRAWRDDRLANPFDGAWAMTCRGVTAARAQGWLLAVRGNAPLPADGCGAPSPVTLAGVGRAEARACRDRRLSLPVVRLSLVRGGTSYTAAAVATALGPLEAALRVATGRGAAPGVDGAVEASFDAAALAPPPAPAAGAPALAAATDVDPAALLQTGIQLNNRGQYIEASRLLNDAISRLGTATPPTLRAELEMEAGLADSNISQFDAADDHLNRAGALIAERPGLDQAAFLQAKITTYRGQDAINRRQFAAALALLGQGGAVADPLNDPATLSQLNQAAGTGARAAVTGADSRQLSRLLLEAQRSWARSVAALSLNDLAAARTALDDGAGPVDQLQRLVTPDAVAALKARMQRQYGRLAARRGRPQEAVRQFDCALATLQGVAPPASELPCALAGTAGSRARVGAGGAAGPMVAETEMERAALMSQVVGVSRGRVLDDFAQATDTLLGAGAAGGQVPASVETYLDMLAAEDAARPSPANKERFFRALQAVGEPTVARQVAQLERTVAADGPSAARLRDRSELERTLVRLRYQIAGAAAAERPALETERADAETRLAAVDAALARDPKLRAVNDQPVTVAEMRAGLRPGEAYLKVVQMRRRAFGVAIDGRDARVYALDAPASAVGALAGRVRASIRDDSGYLPFFDVPAAYALFKLVAGPAEPMLLGASALVIDPSGPFANLPAGVLVTDLASVRRYAANKKAAPNDFSRVSFLAGRAALSAALSPRSFLIARALPPSRETRAFIGFGQNAPAPVLSPALAATKLSLGAGCDVTYGELAQVMNANRPVSAAELGLAAAALNDAGAPEVTGAAFTDRAVIAASERGDLAKYQVVHFATHGLPETRMGCARVPPSLITTLAAPAEGAPPSDGLLSFRDIAALRLDANLVVLSACDTASGVSGIGGRLGGQDESGATLDGLVRAFITANARAVLATFWKVPATAASEDFMRAFYRAGRTETLGAALKDAQGAAIANPATSHPYYWGAYFLAGDASKHMLTAAPGPKAPAATQTAAPGAKTPAAATAAVSATAATAAAPALTAATGA